MSWFSKLIVYCGFIVATYITLDSSLMFPSIKLNTEKIVTAIEKDAGKIALSEDERRKFNNYMRWISQNDKALREWGDARGDLHVYLYLIYIVSTIVLLRTVGKKKKNIKELGGRSG